MRKLTMTLTAALLVLGAMSLQADAQNSRILALKNQSPIVKLAGCRGFTGACGCAPGWVSACRYRCCRCVPC